jgi:hypothetical protein
MASLISEPEGRRRQILTKSEPTHRAHGRPATLPVDAWNKWNLSSFAWRCGKGSSTRASSIRPDRIVAFMIQLENILGRPRENQVSTKTMMGGRQEIQVVASPLQDGRELPSVHLGGRGLPWQGGNVSGTKGLAGHPPLASSCVE